MGRVIGLLVIAALFAGLVTASVAGACSCADRSSGADGERAGLVRGKAFIGRVVSKRRVDGGRVPIEDGTFSYRVRIARSFNVRLPRELELTSSSNSAACGFEWRSGERVAGYLFGRPGDWSTGSCSLADPDDLLRDSRPYPKPLRRGRVAALAWGSFSGAKVMALDRRGRILGYGFGGGEGWSVCPGSAVALEHRVDRQDRGIIYTRRISDLRILSARRAPFDAAEIRCLDPSGSSLVVFTGGRPFDTLDSGRFRLIRMYGRSQRLVRRGRGTYAAFSQRLAVTLEGARGERLVVTDLLTSRSRPVARVARAGPPSLSPDGARVALVSEGSPDPPRRNSRLVVVDLRFGPAHVRKRRLASPFAGGDLLWQDARHLLSLPNSERSRPITRYDAQLRRRARFGRWLWGHATTLGSRLVAVADDRFESIDLRRGRQTGRALPTESTSALLAVPGRTTIIASARRPTPRRPVARRACARSKSSGG